MLTCTSWVIRIRGSVPQTGLEQFPVVGSAAQLAAANSALTSWYDGRHQHVVYVSSDAHVHELLFDVGVRCEPLGA